MGLRTSTTTGQHVPRSARWAATVVDELLEVSVAGSFSSLGIGARRALRRRIGDWAPAGDMTGRSAVVTGGTSGIGLAIAEGLAAAGAHVHVVGRDPGRAEDARRSVASAGRRRPGRPVPGVAVTLGDLGDPRAVRRVAAAVAADHAALDVLVHAAGTLSRQYTTGPDGTEATLAVHVLAPFLLTGLLRPNLVAAARTGHPRVLTVTSGGMYAQRFDLRRLEARRDGYDGVTAYARAKRAQVLLAEEWARRLGPDGVASHVLHPGWVDTPGLRHALPGFARRVGPVLRSPEDGADTAVWLAATPGVDRYPGALWHDRRRRSPYHLPWTWVPRTTRTAQAAALWTWCAARPGWDPGAPGQAASSLRTAEGPER